jgi:plastocyanin
MSRKRAGLAVAVAAVALAACAGRSGENAAPNGVTYVLPGMQDFAITANVPPDLRRESSTVSEELPVEGLGTVHDPHWNATLGGYTQQKFSQALGFPPGTKITIKNISKSITHTLNVVEKIAGPPAKFPKNPNLPLNPSGGKLQKGYASGPINWGSSVAVTLGHAGIYLIGCHFHYHEGMQDVFVVAKGATPGPQATAPAAR